MRTTVKSNRGNSPLAQVIRRARVLVIVLALSATLTGCGTNLNELFFQASGAVGQTFLDQFLTDLANRSADSGSGWDAVVDGGEGDDLAADDDDVVDPVVDDGGTTGPAGDAVAGQAVFAGNGCGGCHCADAGGGCAMAAPSLVGVPQERLDGMAQGGGHPVPIGLTAQQLADVAAYLTSLGAG